MFNAIILQAAAWSALHARNLGLLSSKSPGSPPTRDDKIGAALAWISIAVLLFAGIMIAAMMNQEYK